MILFLLQSDHALINVTQIQFRRERDPHQAIYGKEHTRE
jgi:hypothetical protein